MKEAYILDFNILAEQNLSITEFITLLQLHNSETNYEIHNNVINSLQEKQFIKIVKEQDEEIIIIREKGILLIDFLLIEGLNSTNNKKIIKRSPRSINNDINDFISEFRSLWKGIKPGSMGSEKACKDKMSKWMKDNPTYSKEDILRAAKTYIKSVDNHNFIQQADYFIYKKDAHGEQSRLSAFIDEIDIQEDGWGSSLN